MIGVHLIHENGAVLPAMTSEIALAVTIQIEPARHDPARNGLLPYGSTNLFSLPFDFTRETDIDGDECGHRNPEISLVLNAASRAGRIRLECVGVEFVAIVAPSV
jgi:hypothetical protein